MDQSAEEMALEQAVFLAAFMASFKDFAYLPVKSLEVGAYSRRAWAMSGSYLPARRTLSSPGRPRT